MIREGVLDSEAIFRAGESAEVLFMRLMLVADDHGRFDGRVSVICRRCWPIGGPTEKEVLDRLVALTENGLVVSYEVDGKPFIYIPKFSQRLRTKTSKYPEPPGGQPSDVGQMSDNQPTNVGQAADGCRPEVEVEVKGSRSEEKQSAAPALEVPEPQPPTPFPTPAPAEAVATKLTAKDYVSILAPHDILTNVFDQVLIGWALSDIPAARVEEAIVIAKRRKGGERIHTRYLDPIVRDPAATTAPVPAAKSGKDQAEAKVAKTAAQVAEQASWKADPMPESMRKFVHKAGSA